MSEEPPTQFAETYEDCMILSDWFMSQDNPKEANLLRMKERIWFPMVYCAPGSFVTDFQKKVTLTRGFWISKFLVTQEFYSEVKEKNPSYHTVAWLKTLSSSRWANANNFPVECVTWGATFTFCEALTRKLGSYNYKFQLPTSAQWEYACRAGTTTKFAFGDSLGLNDACFRTHLHPKEVGSYPPNPWGLYDMHGNLWEWCRDRRQEGFVLEGIDPFCEPISREWRYVVRGGGYESEDYDCRSSGLLGYDSHHKSVGFRVILQ